MILAAVAAVLVAVLLVIPPGRLARRRLTPPTVDRGRRSVNGYVLVAVAVMVAAPVAGVLGFGTRGLAVTVSAELALATAVALTRAGAARRRAAHARTEVAHACQVLARLVAVGQTPVEALGIASQDCPVLVEAAAMQQIGGDPVEVWRAASARPGQAGLLPLARAWQVSHTTGAAMARPLGDVAAALRADRVLTNLVQAELSAPRATGRLLALLPVAGLVLGYLIGGDPLDFLLDHGVGQLCLVIGVALACAGVLWVERLAARTTQGT